MVHFTPIEEIAVPVITLTGKENLVIWNNSLRSYLLVYGVLHFLEGEGTKEPADAPAHANDYEVGEVENAKAKWGMDRFFVWAVLYTSLSSEVLEKLELKNWHMRLKDPKIVYDLIMEVIPRT
ncbi:hypothetical protein B0T24DRAFT_643308 [Lasiosphaeria ovina]|uniref:Uncharacterized protein n=1 Tax=Lasiosphaeria ovina TaxID=92902 RepID=A0AAE0MZ55_9PEZI|nr:hypothetical protein B0T24DRAFT_643308 [Lasiosphaeria ovina]